MPGSTSSHQSALAGVALNAEGGAPAEIELIPAGPDVVGHDGRRWTMRDPAAVIAASDPKKRPIAIDWEHAGMIRPDQGLDAPAAGWIDGLEARNGAVWGKVSWTPRAAQQIADREYRFFSPVFTFDAVTKAIKRLAGGGLTNNPNLSLAAMCRRESDPLEDALDLAARMRGALGLAADATEVVIVDAANTAVAANRAGPDLTAFAPRADLTAAVNKANELQAKLDARAAADLTAGVEAALNTAQREGKITPASRPAYLAMCKADGGLERFVALAKTLPVIASATRTGAEKKVDETATNTADLSEEELAVCRALGQEPAAYAKSKKEG